MRGIVVSVGALLALLSCGGGAQAGVAGGDSALSRAALLGKQGFVQEFISAGTVQENAPIILAKRKKSKKKSVTSSDVSAGGGGTIQIDPNTAEPDKLMMLPLLDREEAEAIIEYRKTNRIDTPEEMMEIKGVQPTHYRIFKHLIVIREEEKPPAKSREEEHAPPPPQEKQEPQKEH
ncbi:MAG: helix-hairpin-helix domain-containing protein [Candidatus Aureabacteria bacterium]|nr:helix-hairpin-helix domain-containing protein [Candidatus Auribacterota bacterium]